ncbi:MAG: S9 family peptidase [Candidatus Marinimicrobia bacterium]|nr:S9 family peptidase [Candidatus Neomarinimicrobiota bacterium]
MKNFIQSEDIYQLNFVSSPQMSPKGDKIIYVNKRADKKDQCYYSNLQQIHIPSKSDAAFTDKGKYQDMMPKINPNGRQLVFVRIKKGVPSLRSISMYGGESKELTTLPQGDINDIQFSPDGKQIAIIFAKLKTSIPIEKDKRKEPVCRDTERLFYRLDGHGFIDEEAAQIYLMRASGGTIKKITNSLNDISHFAWSPDGLEIAYTTVDHSNFEMHMEEEDIFLLRLEEKHVSKLAKPAGPVSFVKYEPQGGKIYFGGHFNPYYSWGADNTDIHSLDLESGEIKNLTASLDRTIDMLTLGDITPSFVPQSPIIKDNIMLFTVSSEGANPLYSLNLKNGELEVVLQGPECIVDYSPSADGKNIAIHLAQMDRPDEIWHLALQEEKQLTRVSFANDKYLEKLQFSLPEIMRVPVKGAEIMAWLQLPPDFDEKKTYPLILNIHGGPRTQYGYTWFHEMHTFAAKGYVVVYSNPRGSQGYGKAFADAITGKWGQPAQDDCMAVVDAVLEKGYVDPKRLYVTGGSYGGYMTNWIVSQTQRFRAAVAQRSISDLGTFFGTSDIGWDLVNEFKGTPWEKPELYAKWSPLTYLKNIETPLMLIHSENDLRCPMEQAERLFAPLKYMGKDVRLVRFPESSHGLSRGGRPDRRIKRLDLMVEWFGKYK